MGSRSKREYGAEAETAGIVLALALLAIGLPEEAADSVGDDAGTVAADPSPVTPREVTDPTSLADLPWAWLLFAVVAVVGVVGGLWVGFHAWVSIRRTLNQRREELAARAERRARHAEQWADLRARGQAAVDSWLAYETDLGLLLRFPVMADLTDPVVQQVVRDTSAVRRFLRLDKPSDPDAPVSGSPFARAVQALEASLPAAERHANQVRDSRFDKRERQQLKDAQNLLARALDAGNHPHERHLAYQRVVKILERLLPVPDKALAQLAAAVNEALALEPAPATLVN